VEVESEWNGVDDGRLQTGYLDRAANGGTIYALAPGLLRARKSMGEDFVKSIASTV